MASYTMLQEVNVIWHFVNILKSQSKTFKAQDAHCLLVHNQVLKNFLQSHWKLSDLAEFFKKYTQYFKVDTDGTVLLKSPSLTYEELTCVSFYFELFMKRQNRPAHITCVVYFANSSGVEQFLRANYNVKDLSPFFENHSDFFLLDDGFVSLKNYKPSVDNVPKELPKPLSKTEKKYFKKMDKIAVDFYVDLIQLREEIDSKKAHSFIQDDVELRDYLRNYYQLSNLQPFFEKHSDVFKIAGSTVRLAPVSTKTKPLQTVLQKSEPVVPQSVAKSKPPEPEQMGTDEDGTLELKTLAFYVEVLEKYGDIDLKQAHSYLQKNVDMRNYLKSHYQLADLGPFFQKYPNMFSVTSQTVRLAPGPAEPPLRYITPKAIPPEPPFRYTIPKVIPLEYQSIVGASKTTDARPLDKNVQGLSSQRNSGHLAGTMTSNTHPVSIPAAGVSKQAKNSNSSISEKTNLSNLLSLVMSFSAENTKERTSLNSVNECRTVQDASCQTLSTGPVLSLNIMFEQQHE